MTMRSTLWTVASAAGTDGGVLGSSPESGPGPDAVLPVLLAAAVAAVWFRQSTARRTVAAANLSAVACWRAEQLSVLRAEVVGTPGDGLAPVVSLDTARRRRARAARGHALARRLLASTRAPRPPSGGSRSRGRRRRRRRCAW